MEKILAKRLIQRQDKFLLLKRKHDEIDGP